MVPTSKAQLQAAALSQAQASLNPITKEVLKFQNMYSQLTSLISKIQSFRSASRKTVLIGSIKDAGDPIGTATNLALNARTVVDRKITQTATKEFATKILQAVF